MKVMVSHEQMRLLFVPVKNLVITIHSMQLKVWDRRKHCNFHFPRTILALHFRRQFFSTVAAFQPFAVDIPVTV